MRVEKQLSCVELHHDARHAPDIWGFVPHKTLKDHLRRSVLSRVDDQSVSFIIICRSTEIDHLNFSLIWFQPCLLSFLGSRDFPITKMGTVSITLTFLWAINVFLKLYLLYKQMLKRKKYLQSESSGFLLHKYLYHTSAECFRVWGLCASTWSHVKIQ